MFLNESINVKDSAILMGFIRQALVENLKEKGANSETIKFVTEDAKDCEVLSLAMYGKACPTDNPVMAEAYLMSNLKDVVLENASELPFSDEYKVSDFIHEIGGLSMVDSDSMSVIQEGFIQEKYSKSAGADSAKYMSDRDRIQAGIDDRLDRLRARDAAEATGPGIENEAKAKDMADRIRTAQAAGDSEAGPKGEGGKDTMTWWDNLKKMVGDTGENISKGWSTFTKFVNDHTGGHAKAVGVTALVGVAAFLAYKAYQRYFSKAAKACAGKSGAERTACIAEAKKAAVKQQMNMLKRSMAGCKAAANPAKCRSEINAKISKLQAKLA